MVKTEGKNARGRQNTALIPQITRDLFSLGLSLRNWPDRYVRGTFSAFPPNFSRLHHQKTTALPRKSHQLGDLPTI